MVKVYIPDRHFEEYYLYESNVKEDSKEYLYGVIRYHFLVDKICCKSKILDKNTLPEYKVISKEEIINIFEKYLTIIK